MLFNISLQILKQYMNPYFTENLNWKEKDMDVFPHIFVNGEWKKANKLHSYKDSFSRVYNGALEWHKYGMYHREYDKPAFQVPNISRKLPEGHRLKKKKFNVYNSDIARWYYEGKLHRFTDKAAVHSFNGTKTWYVHGEIHRGDEKPAIVQTDGTKKWFNRGKLHRNYDLPAAIYFDGSKEWFLNGYYHREQDKPAIERSDGMRAWYYRGQLIKKTFQSKFAQKTASLFD